MNRVSLIHLLPLVIAMVRLTFCSPDIQSVDLLNLLLHSIRLDSSLPRCRYARAFISSRAFPAGLMSSLRRALTPGRGSRCGDVTAAKLFTPIHQLTEFAFFSFLCSPLKSAYELVKMTFWTFWTFSAERRIDRAPFRAGSSISFSLSLKVKLNGLAV